MNKQQRDKLVALAASQIKEHGSVGYETDADGCWIVEVDGITLKLSEQETGGIMSEAFNAAT